MGEITIKRVLVHGYTNNNLGDDLFFEILFKRYPNVMFYLPTLNITYKRIFSGFSNVKVIDFCKISKYVSRQVYKLPKLYSQLNMKKFDAVVCIGGSLFIDKKNPTKKNTIETEHYSFIFDWDIAKSKGIPYYLIGCNWGPCYNEYFEHFFRKAFKSMKDICFRDQYSYELFKEYNNVRLAADIAFTYNYRDDFPTERQIAVSLMDIKSKPDIKQYDKTYKDMIVRLCDKLIEDDYRINLISFCKRERDEEAVNDIYSRISKKESANRVCYSENINGVLGILKKSEAIIATRFHAMILGWVLNKTVFPIVYSEKMQNVINDIYFSGSYACIDRMDNIDVDGIVQYLKSNYVQNNENIKNNAEEQFERLDELLFS